MTDDRSGPVTDRPGRTVEISRVTEARLAPGRPDRPADRRDPHAWDAAVGWFWLVLILADAVGNMTGVAVFTGHLVRTDVASGFGYLAAAVLAAQAVGLGVGVWRPLSRGRWADWAAADGTAVGLVRAAVTDAGSQRGLLVGGATVVLTLLLWMQFGFLDGYARAVGTGGLVCFQLAELFLVVLVPVAVLAGVRTNAADPDELILTAYQPLPAAVLSYHLPALGAGRPAVGRLGHPTLQAAYVLAFQEAADGTATLQPTHGAVDFAAGRVVFVGRSALQGQMAGTDTVTTGRKLYRLTYELKLTTAEPFRRTVPPRVWARFRDFTTGLADYRTHYRGLAAAALQAFEKTTGGFTSAEEAQAKLDLGLLGTRVNARPTRGVQAVKPVAGQLLLATGVDLTSAVNDDYAPLVDIVSAINGQVDQLRSRLDDGKAAVAGEFARQVLAQFLPPKPTDEEWKAATELVRLTGPFLVVGGFELTAELTAGAGAAVEKLTAKYEAERARSREATERREEVAIKAGNDLIRDRQAQEADQDRVLLEKMPELVLLAQHNPDIVKVIQALRGKGTRRPDDRRAAPGLGTDANWEDDQCAR